MAEYRSVLDIRFDVEDSIIKDLKEELTNYGIPSIDKVGVGFSFCRSLPFANERGHAITAKCIKNSINSGKFSKFDFEHEQDEIIGSVIGLKIYDDTDELIPDKPLKVFGLGALYRNRLKDLYIDPKDLVNWGTSMEVLYSDFAFYWKGKKITKEEAPNEWLLRIDDFKEGIPVYHEGSRVIFVLGGYNEDAIVTFNGNALTLNPADEGSGVLLAVASQNKNKVIFDLEGADKMKTYTEDQYNQAVANIKNELEPKIKDLESKLSQAKANTQEKDKIIKDLEGKLSEANASLKNANDKITELENKIKEKELDERYEQRVQALASKNLTYREEKKEFIRNADEEAFNDWVADLEAIAKANVTQAQANKLENDYIFSLTQNKGNLDENPFL